MTAIAARPGSVPLAWRQLRAELAKVVVALVAVAAAAAPVPLLSGLRRGMGEQATVYLEHQPPVLVGQAGARDFLSQTSVLPERVAARVARVPGVSDLTLVSGDLRAAADAIRLARKTLRTIKGNLFWAFAYNIAAIPLAIAGLLNPIIAAAAMAASSLFVVSNSLGLKCFQSARQQPKEQP